MNEPIRVIPWIARISGFLTRCHIFVESLIELVFPPKPVILLDIQEMSQEYREEWIKKFRESLNAD